MSGGSAFYVFVYSIFYFVTKARLDSFTFYSTVIFYFTLSILLYYYIVLSNLFYCNILFCHSISFYRILFYSILVYCIVLLYCTNVFHCNIPLSILLYFSCLILYLNLT